MKVFFLNQKILRKKISAAVHNLAKKRPEVTKAVLFGSVAENRALPSSDIDILLIVEETTERFIDRSLHYLPYFRTLPMGVDCFVYTQTEIQSGNQTLSLSALKNGETVFERAAGC